MKSIVTTWLSVFLICAMNVPEGEAQDHQEELNDISLDSLLSLHISTAAKYEQTISEAPASVTIITAEAIERFGYRTLDEVLASVRGFYLSNDRNYSYLGVRGFSRPTDYNNRILLLLNGHRLNENVYGSAFIWTELGLDLEVIERIEIVRGPGSALYGTSAMFAVINIITKSPLALDGLHLAVQKGSHDRLHSAVCFGKTFSDFEILVSGLWGDIDGQDWYYQEYDDPQSNNGIARNLDWDRYHGLLATMAYRDFILQATLSSREKGIPTGAYGVTFNDPAAKTLDERQSIDLKYDTAIDADKRVMLRAYLDHYGYRGWFPYDQLLGDASEGDWFGSELQFQWDLEANYRIITGAEYTNTWRADYRNDLSDTSSFYHNAPFTAFSLYLANEWQVLENLSLNFGLRRDEYAGSSTTPRGAVIYNFAKTGTLKFLYGNAFRAPNVYESYYEDPGTGFKSNPDLKAERIRTMEVVCEQRLSDELLGIVSVYNYHMDDLIDTAIDPADSLVRFQNVGKVNASGIELECDARLQMGLSGYLSYVYQYAEDAQSNLRLSNSPSHLAKLGLTYSFFKQLRAAVELQYESERRTIFAERTSSFLLTNLNLVAKPKPGRDGSLAWLNGLRLSLLVRNLFDVSYATPGGFEHIQPAIPQEGRNLTLEVGYRF